MTYRNDRSYLRFPEKMRTVPEKDLEPASAAMDRLLRPDRHGERLRDAPAVTKSQDVYRSPQVDD
jgi:hypothetical protein